MQNFFNKHRLQGANKIYKNNKLGGKNEKNFLSLVVLLFAFCFSAQVDSLHAAPPAEVTAPAKIEPASPAAPSALSSDKVGSGFQCSSDIVQDTISLLCNLFVSNNLCGWQPADLCSKVATICSDVKTCPNICPSTCSWKEKTALKVACDTGCGYIEDNPSICPVIVACVKSKCCGGAQLKK